MSTKPVFRRKKYLIKQGLQFRYIGVVFALVILASVITGYTVFATGWTLLGEKLASVYPQGRLIYVFKAANVALMRNLLLASPFIFLLALISSHKIAGPIYRIEKDMGEIARGNLALRIKLRRGDELQDIADAINAMTEKLGKDIALNKNSSAKILKGLGELKSLITSSSSDRAKIDSVIDELQKTISEANSSLSHWMIS